MAEITTGSTGGKISLAPLATKLTNTKTLTYVKSGKVSPTELISLMVIADLMDVSLEELLDDEDILGIIRGTTGSGAYKSYEEQIEAIRNMPAKTALAREFKQIYEYKLMFESQGLDLQIVTERENRIAGNSENMAAAYNVMAMLYKEEGNLDVYMLNPEMPWREIFITYIGDKMAEVPTEKMKTPNEFKAEAQENVEKLDKYWSEWETGDPLTGPDKMMDAWRNAQRMEGVKESYDINELYSLAWECVYINDAADSWRMLGYAYVATNKKEDGSEYTAEEQWMIGYLLGHDCEIKDNRSIKEQYDHFCIMYFRQQNLVNDYGYPADGSYDRMVEADIRQERSDARTKGISTGIVDEIYTLTGATLKKLESLYDGVAYVANEALDSNLPYSASILDGLGVGELGQSTNEKIDQWTREGIEQHAEMMRNSTVHLSIFDNYRMRTNIATTVMDIGGSALIIKATGGAAAGGMADNFINGDMFSGSGNTVALTKQGTAAVARAAGVAALGNVGVSILVGDAAMTIQLIRSQGNRDKSDDIRMFASDGRGSGDEINEDNWMDYLDDTMSDGSLDIIRTGDRTPDGHSFSGHGADQANERGFTPEAIDEIIRNGKMTQSTGDKGVEYLYKDSRGNYVKLNERGGIITVFSYQEGGYYIPK